MGERDETIAVREEERLDVERLEGYLRGRLPGSERPLALRQFPGGRANLTYLLDYGSHEYVLRRPPLGPIAPRSHDMAREYRVLAALHPHFPLAPRAYLLCEDETVAGATFFVMERRRGLVVRRTLPESLAAQPDAPRRMSGALVDALAAFHAVDYEAAGLENLGEPAGFVARQIEGWYRRWQRAAETPLPEMDALYRWLRDERPETQRYALVHNDFKLDNVMFAPDDPDRVVAIFDWDMCTLGDPLSDLGALLTYWTEPDDPPYLRAIAPMPPAELGWLTRDALVARYAAGSGVPVERLDFYHVLGIFRLIVIVAQIYIRYRRGQTSDPRFAALGEMIPLLARRAGELAGGGTTQEER